MNKIDLIRFSYCYFANAIGKEETPQFDEEELNDKFQLKWMAFERALNLLENENKKIN